MNHFVADPHWDWWIVWYFFLGGIAAGAYFMAALVELVGDDPDRRLARVGYYLAAPLVAVCGVLLVLDLDQPTRFWHMLLDAETLVPHVKFWSPMSIGAWALLLFGLVSGVSFLGALAEDGCCGLGRLAGVAARLHRSQPGRGFDLVGCVCGFFIASYTGALLTATNRPVWSDSPWIAALFLASSATTGIAAMELLGWLWLSPGSTASAAEESQTLAGLAAPAIAVASQAPPEPPAFEKLRRADGWALGLELAVLVLFLGSIRGVAWELIDRGPFLWLLVGTLGCGVCLPLLIRLRPRLVGTATPALAASLVLIGGFVLRYSLLAAAPALIRAAPAITTVGAQEQARVSQSEAEQFTQLLSLVRERLELMDQVALAKWRAGRPVEDSARERELLAAMRDAAVERGLEPDAVEAFFRVQIEAAKVVQRACFDEWAVRPPPQAAPAPDLTRDLRPRLDTLNRQLIDSFARCLASLTTPAQQSAFCELGEKSLQRVRLDEKQRTELIAGLLRACEVHH